MLRFILFLALFAPFCLFAQVKTKSKAKPDPAPVVKKLDAVSFLKEVLGASYSKSDKSWVLPRTEENKAVFENDAEGGLFVAVDTIIKRNVGENQEQWVLFIVEGYIYNFASMVKTEAGWELKTMKYSLHQGAPGEYSPLDFTFQMISQKTFISIKEAWYAPPGITSDWLLFDPFTLKSAGRFDTDKELAEDELPEQYKFFKTDRIEYKPGDALLPDVVLTQSHQEKIKGKKATTQVFKVRYQWNDKKGAYELGKKSAPMKTQATPKTKN